MIAERFGSWGTTSTRFGPVGSMATYAGMVELVAVMVIATLSSATSPDGMPVGCEPGAPVEVTVAASAL